MIIGFKARKTKKKIHEIWDFWQWSLFLLFVWEKYVYESIFITIINFFLLLFFFNFMGTVGTVGVELWSYTHLNLPSIFIWVHTGISRVIQFFSKCYGASFWLQMWWKWPFLVSCHWYFLLLELEFSKLGVYLYIWVLCCNIQFSHSSYSLT